ncbi:MAG: hypothetical protein ACYTF6_02310 [Planctomycetota bacterium]|jgi:hypothetical protein
MCAMTNFQWVLIGCLAGLYLLTCVRVAMSARRLGQNPVLWFFITLFFTAIPAAIFTSYHRIKTIRPRARGNYWADKTSEPSGRDGAEAIRRCRHCGEIITGQGEELPDGTPTCPKCGQTIDEEHFA